MSAWVWILILGLGTFVIRASFMLPRDREAPSPYLARVLQLVPAAVLSALVTPALVFVDGEIAVPWTNERLVAGVIAAIVAWRTKSVMITLLAGMAVLWAIRLL